MIVNSYSFIIRSIDSLIKHGLPVYALLNVVASFFEKVVDLCVQASLSVDPLAASCCLTLAITANS